MNRWTALAIACLCSCAGPPEARDAGGARWVRTYWSKSRRQGDGAVTNRVNSPDTATGKFKDRPEAKADGRLVFTIAEDPRDLAGAELTLELWGGHPGTANKRFTLNGGAPYAIPEVGAAEGHCTYSFPSIPLRLQDVRRGENVFQFSCDRGTTFWGHFLFVIAALRVAFRTPPRAIRVVPGLQVSGERAELTLEGDLDAIGLVEVEASFWGYDDRGNGDGSHGFTKEGRPEAIVGRADAPPFRVSWDLSMIPDQEEISFRTILHPRDDASLSMILPASPFPLHGRSVSIHAPAVLPKPFWSRAGNAKTCTIELDRDPSEIQRAELHLRIWDGGGGTVGSPFTLNGRPLPIASAGRHDFLYRVVPIDPAWLRKGPNEIRVLSDTDHHGIEMLLPGPAIVLRARR